jgi:DNA processing protein
VLFVEGPVAGIDGGVAVVGTRQCTAYGRGVARHLGVALAAAGEVVVSGLARGVDAAAHRGALEGGRTVAVLGHGLLHTAPASHRRLREQILASGGSLVTGFHDEVAPRPHTFPIRNRWIAGLSRAVVVVEAAKRSGASITARLALEADRPVYAVPGPIAAPQSEGCLRLLAEGASVVVDVAGLVEQLSGSRPRSVGTWLEALFAGASVEEVARLLGRSTVELFTELTRLEVAGVVVR